MFTPLRLSAIRRTLSSRRVLTSPRRAPAPHRLATVLGLFTTLLIVMAGLGSRQPSPALAGSAAVPGIPPHFGLGSSSLIIVNRDCRATARPAQTMVDIYPQSGNPGGVALSRPHLAGCRATFELVASHSEFRQHGLFSAQVGADVAVDALAGTTWSGAPANTMSNRSRAGREVVVPWVSSGDRGLSAYVTVRNTDGQLPATALLTLQDATTGLQIGPLTRRIAANGAVTVALNGANDRDLMQVPAGFTGSVTVRADLPIAVQVFTEWNGSAFGMASTEGVPVDLAAATLHAPLVYNAGPEGRTWIAVANVGEQPTDVLVRYRLDGTGCPATALARGGTPVRLEPGGSTVIDQGEPWSPDPNLGPSGVRPGCVGSAEIVGGAGGRLVSTVFAQNRSGSLAGYQTLREDDGARQVILPTFLKRVGVSDLSTLVAVKNLSDQPASVELLVRDDRGQPLAAPCPECRVTLAPWGSAIWSPPLMNGLPLLQGGSAVVRSDRPIGVTVAETSGNNRSDSAMYLGIPALEADEAPDLVQLPMLLINAALGGEPRAWTTHAIYVTGLERSAFGQ